MYANVKGGTGAGRKRPLKPKGGAWDCDCRRNPGYLIRCPRCGKGRP